SSAKDSPDMYAGEEPAYYEEPGEALPAVDGYAGWPAREEPYGYGKGGSGNGVQASAGTLTAGRQDDNRYFSEFLKKMEEMSVYAQVWKIYPSRRLTVLAEGINNAKVALSDEKGNVLSYARTNAEGYAYLYYDLYDEKSASVPYKIGVSNGETFGEYVLKGDEGDVIRLSCGEPLEMKKLDVLIMLDTTGSMGDEISYLQAELEDVMKRVKAEAGNATVRLSMNFYRDHGDNYTVDYHPFTEDISECVSLLMKESADGGGDFPEAVDEALLNACDHAWDPDAVKIMFLILDAPPHEESDRQGTLSNLRKAIDSARRQGVRIVPVVASGIDDSTEYLMRSVAASTGGVYVFLTNHSGVGGDHKDPNVDQYAVEKLNDLMVKIILSYWNGTPIEDPQKTEESGETGETSETGDIDIEPSEPEHLFWGEDGTVSIPSAVSEHPLLKPVAEIYQYSVHAGWIDPESDPDVYDGCNNADVVNRDGTRGGHLPVFLVRSAEDYRYIAETYPELCLEGTEDAFGDAFFEDAALAVLYVPASSGSARFHVFYMITGGDNFVAHVAEEREGDGTTDMSGWTIVAAVPRATADAASKADAVLEKE
ncbi:MAG: VWA domain-containing protein, partial [Clostridia bacterium]|nr:VWA domain-containing protein [Clostridia bacterium]